MPEFLTFQLYGPMQSWGEIAVGGYRSSATYPSKSAVLGLIAAALGIERSEETMIQTLHESLKMAVCVFSEGQMMRDFHTLQEPPKGIYSSRQQEGQAITKRRFHPKGISTTLSEREYLCDAYFGICLWKNDASTIAFSLQQVLQALQTPVFTLYLGRKSCPLALPLAPKLLQAPNLRSVFNNLESFHGLDDLGLNKQSNFRVYWEQELEEILGLNALFCIERPDQLLSRQRWQFGNRSEYQGFISNQE